MRARLLLLAALLVACDKSPTAVEDDVGAAAISAKPLSSTTTTAAAGEYNLAVINGQEARLVIPASAGGKCNVPLILMLHGGFGPTVQLQTIVNEAAKHGAAVLLPRSRGITWDMVSTGAGQDVQNINRALEQTMAMVCVDRKHIAMAGFSDGASSALMMGMANGQLFTHVMAFSAGTLIYPGRRGLPKYFISHGTGDGVLSFNNVERLFVPYLTKLGYDVTFRPFIDGHTIPPEVAAEALEWFME